MTREALRGRPDLQPPRLLRVVDDDGEVYDRCPGCREKDDAVAALQTENLRLLRKTGALTKQLHEDLDLRPETQSVKRVYAEWRKFCKPRAQAKIPKDRLEMGLARRKDFSEEQMLQAVHGAAGMKPDKKTGKVWQDWENIFRNTGNCWRYIEDAKKSPPVVIQDAALAEKCDCGHPRVDHMKAMHNPAGLEPCGHRDCSCVTFDATKARADEWVARRQAELARAKARAR